MKKFQIMTIAVLTAASVAGGTALPAKAAESPTTSQKYTGANYTVYVGYGSCSSLEALLEQVKDKLPELSLPECVLPEVNKPETNLPETNKPETDIPEENLPEAETPETGIPETNIPGTNSPGNNSPGTNSPGNEDESNDNIQHPYLQQVVDLVNTERVKEGLAPLKVDSNVQVAAQVRAKECEQLFSHTRPDGSSFSTALREQNVSYRTAGENIAWGQRTPEEVMKGWMNSSGHRSNIMNPNFSTIGIGYYQNANGTNFWCQLFT